MPTESRPSRPDPSARPARPDRLAWLWVAVILVAAPGCTSTVETYPDRSTPLKTYRTFVRAWREGDLNVLRETYTQTPLGRFEERRSEMGDEGLSEWYRRDAALFELGEPTMDEVPPMHASILVPVIGGQGAGANQRIRFDLVRAGREWRVHRVSSPRPQPKKKEDG